PSRPTTPLFPYTTLFRSGHSPDHVRETNRATAGFPLAGSPGIRSAPPHNSFEAGSRIFVPGGQSIPNRVRPQGGFAPDPMEAARSEEHTSELQSRGHLVC